MNLRSKVMLERSWCVVWIATLSLGWAGAVCERGRSWWDRRAGACAPCSLCDPVRRLAVLLPCELHRDTVCHALQHIDIFPPTESNDTSDYEYSSDYDEEYVDSEPWGQWPALTVAASGCVVFFVVVSCLTLHHAKQWRILKQALKSDVQDLSAKLRLMESGAEPPVDPARATDHIYCNIHVTKENLLGAPMSKKGNVYTQEKPCS
ncbi:hypothetical protein JYU34_009570 [Plutella xylostella]|uniref:TNFR-Cys domain-containing protein n=1 Tax=Plutella xylostella TaxID=51655 RepID=A0ABQ7QJV7_PLUXY|nr:hypothetical protein JYU34_009570 [Plutella xylostella]